MTNCQTTSYDHRSHNERSCTQLSAVNILNRTHLESLVTVFCVSSNRHRKKPVILNRFGRLVRRLEQKVMNPFNCLCFKTQQSANITNASDEKVQDECHDVISKHTGHFGWWNFMWAFILSLYQMTVGFQVFAFSFQVSVIWIV